MTASRAVAFFIALIVLLVSLSADAAKKKKKKASKKHKTPAAQHTSKSSSKSKSKSKESDRGLPPVEAAPETDEASKEKEAPSKKPAAEPDEGAGAGGEKAESEKKPPPPPPGEETETPAKPAKLVKTPPRESEPSGGEGAPIALSLGLGGKALFRDLTWTQANNALAPYSLRPGPEAALWFEAFPMAFMSGGFAGNIGIYGRFNYGLGASSKTPPPQSLTLTTKYYDFLAGLKIRIPLGTFLPYVTGAYGNQKFALTPTDVTRPNFNYAFASFGAGTRIQLTPAFDIDAGAAFLLVLNPGSAAGEVASNAFYPDAKANGIDASLSLGFRLFSILGLRAGGDFRQLGLSTNYKTTNMGPRAGGATDRNITVWGGVEVVFDGLGGGGGGEEPAPAKKAPAKAKKPAPGEGEPGEEPSVGTPEDKDEGGAGGDKGDKKGDGAGTDGDL